MSLSGEARFAAGPAALFHSRDGGATWQQVGRDLGEVMDIASDIYEPERLWLTTFETGDQLFGQLYTSLNGGDDWTWVADRHGVIWPKESGGIRLIDPRYQFPWDERNGVWQAAADGGEWTQLSSVEQYDFGWSTAFFAHLEGYDGPVRTLSLRGETALWVNTQFVFGSFDGGQTFTNLYTEQVGENRFASRGIDNIVFFDVAASEQAADDEGTAAIYLAMYDMGCFRSLDGGLSWENCNVPELTGAWEGAGGNSFTVLPERNPERAGTVWMTQVGDIGEPVSLVRSDAFGAADSWQISNAGLPETDSITDLALDPTSATAERTLFAAVSGDVYRSQNDGWDWEPVFACGGCRFVAADPHGSGLILAGGEAGLFGSPVGGAEGSWSALGPAEMGGDLSGEFWDWGWRGVRDIEFDEGVSGRALVAVLGEGGRGLSK